jgi:DNA polymerase-3 subunit delta'
LILTDSSLSVAKHTSVVGWKTFGHTAAIRLLAKSFETNRLAHAYLITGPEKVGKRTLALDMASMVNTEPVADMFGQSADIDLSKSHQAERIWAGIHADVRVIDVDTQMECTNPNCPKWPPKKPYTVISVHHIHTLIRYTTTTPFEGSKKIFIVENSQKMTQEAAGTLLKTLEEAHSDVLIVLIAPNVESLPETVVSRCQIIELRPVEPQVIESKLIERFEADEAHARLLSRLARGSPGWAIDAINDPTIIDAHNQAILRFAEIVTGNIEDRFRYARQTDRQFWRDRSAVFYEMEHWIEWWRDVAVMRHKLIDNIINVEWVDLFSEIATEITEEQVSAAVTAIENARHALEANAVPQLTLEVMMLDLPWADPAKIPSLNPESGDGS